MGSRCGGSFWGRYSTDSDASLIALAPDLDAFLHVHRSESHSLVVLALVALPLVILTRNRRTLRTLVLLGAFGVLVHLVLDLFQSATPLFSPLLHESFWISTTLKLGVGGTTFISGSPRLLTEQTTIEPFVSFNEPLLTAPGLAVSVILLIPTLLQIFGDRLRALRKLKP